MTIHTPQSKIYVPMDVIVPHILAIGMEENPYEACGVIVPKVEEAPLSWVKKMLNRADNPFNSYKLDPATITQLVEDLGSDDPAWANVIVWHTHPSGSVGPSQGDMEYRVEGLKYLVVSVPRGEAVFF